MVVSRHHIVCFRSPSAPYLQVQKAESFPGGCHRPVGVLGSTAHRSRGGSAWIAETIGDHASGWHGRLHRVPGQRHRCGLGDCGTARCGAWPAVKRSPVQRQARPRHCGELVINQPMPWMPSRPTPTGGRLREAYFTDFPGRRGAANWGRITGRDSSCSTAVAFRMGTANLYASTTRGRATRWWSTRLRSARPRTRLRARGRAGGHQALGRCAPRHRPDRFAQVHEVPRTF